MWAVASFLMFLAWMLAINYKVSDACLVGAPAKSACLPGVLRSAVPSPQMTLWQGADLCIASVLSSRCLVTSIRLSGPRW